MKIGHNLLEQMYVHGALVFSAPFKQLAVMFVVSSEMDNAQIEILMPCMTYNLDSTLYVLFVLVISKILIVIIDMFEAIVISAMFRQAARHQAIQSILKFPTVAAVVFLQILSAMKQWLTDNMT